MAGDDSSTRTSASHSSSKRSRGAPSSEPRRGSETSSPDVSEPSDEVVDVGWEEVGVAVHGHRDPRVAEVDLDGFGVGAGRCEEAGAGVSEVVNPAEEELARRQDQVARRELDATAVEERLRAWSERLRSREGELDRSGYGV